MKKYLVKEVITPAVILLFLIYYISEALLKLSAPVIDSVPQETFFPTIVWAFGMISAVALLVGGMKKVKAGDIVRAEKEPDKEKAKVGRKPFYVMIATGLLIFFFDILGFMITAPLYLFAMMMIYDDKPQKPVRKAIFSVIICAMVYVLYNIVFQINFPEIWR